MAFIWGEGKGGGFSKYDSRPLSRVNLLHDGLPGQTLSAADVTRAFARETGLPLFLLEESVRLDLAQTRHWLTSRVIGQNEAVDLVVDLFATVKAGLSRPRKPIASLLFIGPTGVGKTEMASGRLADFANAVVIMTSNLAPNPSSREPSVLPATGKHARSVGLPKFRIFLDKGNIDQDHSDINLCSRVFLLVLNQRRRLRPVSLVVVGTGGVHLILTFDCLISLFTRPDGVFKK